MDQHYEGVLLLSDIMSVIKGSLISGKKHSVIL